MKMRYHSCLVSFVLITITISGDHLVDGSLKYRRDTSSQTSRLNVREEAKSDLHRKSNANRGEQLNVQETPMWMRSGKFQGDIIPPLRVQNDRTVDYTSHFDAHVDWINSWNFYHDTWPRLEDPRRLWRSGIIPFKFNSTSALLRSVMMQAFREFHEHTCVRFVEQQPHEFDVVWKRLNITDEDFGCHATLGFPLPSYPLLNMGDGCLTKATAIHELMHVLGFWHEHQRADRDRYVRVDQENIGSNMCYRNFYKKAPLDEEYLTGSYDIKSIMHPPITSYCSKDGRPAMVPRDLTITTMGNTEGLTTEDIYKINVLYNCTDKLRLTTTSTTSTAIPPRTTPPSSSNCPSTKTTHSTDSDGNRYSVCAIVYDQTECNGQKYAIEKGKSHVNLSAITAVSPPEWNWDDKIASLELNPNCTIILCRDMFFGGGCGTLMGGESGKNVLNLDWMESRASSLHCICY